MGEGVCISRRDGEPVWANTLYWNLSGSVRERIAVVCRQFDREHPMVPKTVGAHGDLPVPRMTTILAEDDRAFEVSVTLAPSAALTVLETGGVTGLRSEHSRQEARDDEALVVLIRDATASRRHQEKINAIDLAGGELVRFDADVVRRHNAHERLKLLEEKISRYARSLLHFDHLAIRLLDERTGKLELVIGYGLPADFDSFEIRPALEGNGITGYVAASGRPYICPDTSVDPLYLPGVHGARSSLTIPIRLHDKVIGVMNAESQQTAAFDDEDRQLGEIFARYVAFAVHLLDLLVVERSTTNKSVSGRVETELAEPLADIAHEVELLRTESTLDDRTTRHLERISADLESIRKRIRDCAAGPTTLIGVEQAMQEARIDPAWLGKRVLVATMSRGSATSSAACCGRAGASSPCARMAHAPLTC